MLLETGDVDAARAEFALDKGFVRWINPRLPRVLDDYETWLGEQRAESTPDRFRTWVATEYAPYFYRARIEPLDAPVAARGGAPTELRLRVTNTSRETIPFRSTRDTRRPSRRAPGVAGRRAPARAARRLRRPRARRPARASTWRSPLPAARRARSPGRCEVDLVDEGVKWFSALGSQPLSLPIEVAAAP